MTNTKQPNEITHPCPSSVKEVLRKHGLSGWPALRALVEFTNGSAEALIESCTGFSETDATSRLDEFLARRTENPIHRRTFPEYVPSYADLWDIALRALEDFVAKEIEGLFLGTWSGSMTRDLARFDQISHLIREHGIQQVIASVDRHFSKDLGDAWEVYKYASHLEWPTPPDLEAIERYANTTPEERWGGDGVNGLTPDLEAALRAALEEKGTGKRPSPDPSKGAEAPGKPVSTERYSHLTPEDEAFFKELKELDG